MKYCLFFLPTDFSEIKLERKEPSKNKCKLRYDIWQFIKIDTMFSADFQNELFSSNLNISAKN